MDYPWFANSSVYHQHYSARGIDKLLPIRIYIVVSYSNLLNDIYYLIRPSMKTIEILALLINSTPF